MPHDPPTRASPGLPRIAPWVVERPAPDGDGVVLLGPRFALVQLSSSPGEIDALEGEDLALLRAEGMLVDPPAVPATFAQAEAPSVAEAGAPLLLLVAQPESRSEAEALAGALRACGARATLLESAHARAEIPAGAEALLVPVLAREPGDGSAAVGSWIARHPVLWSGEGLEGLHVGPVLATEEDVERYRRASLGWALMEMLRGLGFGDEWPLSLLQSIREDPRRVARALLAVARAPCGACLLLDEDRWVELWTNAGALGPSAEAVLAAQTWSKGLFRALSVEPVPGLGDSFQGSCLTPCDADPILESNFGQGMTPEEAERTTRGEAVERFSAWAARGRHEEPGSERAIRHFSLMDFHPDFRLDAAGFPAPDASGRYPFDALPMTAVRDEITGERFAVPGFLVPFPAASPHLSPTIGEAASTTTGLAAYPTRQGAILRATLEVIERNNFYPAFLHQAPGCLLSTARLEVRPDAAPVLALLAQIAGLGLRHWLVAYPDDLAAPVVHAFLHDPSGGHMSRGTGSGLTVASAARKALLEALMIRQQQRFLADERAEGRPEITRETDRSYLEWSTAEVVSSITAYLDRQREGWPAVHEAGEEGAELAYLAYLKGALRRKGWQLLVATLPCPIPGWTAVRVLIPGATCHRSASPSAGGRRLLGAAFRWGVPC